MFSSIKLFDTGRGHLKLFLWDEETPAVLPTLLDRYVIPLIAIGYRQPSEQAGFIPEMGRSPEKCIPQAGPLSPFYLSHFLDNLGCLPEAADAGELHQDDWAFPSSPLSFSPRQSVR